MFNLELEFVRIAGVLARALIAGIAGEPTYLTLEEDGTLSDRGLVDSCTHLGCTFPWNPTAEQFQCPCHGSRYTPDGSVERGPADRPLKLVRVAVVKEAIVKEAIVISPWTAIDPRTGEKAWWV